MTDADLIALARRVFPIATPNFVLELGDTPLLDDRGALAPTVRLTTFRDGVVESVEEQVLVLVPAAERISERVIAYLDAVRAELLARTPDELDAALPMDLFVGELLAEHEILPEAFARILNDPRARLLVSLPREQRRGVVIDPVLRSAVPVLGNPELEACLTDDDVELYGVYSDWLTDRGDPRGELIAVQLARDVATADETLAAREQLLLAEYAYEWLGGFAWLPECDFSTRWHWGFVHRITIGSEDGPTENSIGDVTVHGFVELPSANLIRELVVRPHGYWDEAAFEVMGAPGFPNGWTALDIKTPEYSELGAMAPAYPNLAKLETLRLESQAMELGSIVLPALISCELVTRGLTVANLGELRAATWPKLERLVLWLGTAGLDDCDVELDDLAWIFAGTNLANVRELGLCGRDAGELLWLLAEAPILAQLEVLDLGDCYFDAAARQFLADHAAVFATLGAIRVHESGTGILANTVTEDRCIPVQA